MALLARARAWFRERRLPREEVPAAVAPIAAAEPEPVFDLLASWPPRLALMSDSLLRISRETEMEFISLGDSLQAFSGRFSENSALTSSIVSETNTGSGFDFTSLRGVFEDAYQGTGHCIEAVSRGMQDMKALQEGIDRINGLRIFLRQLSKSIMTVGTYIRIETARIDDTGFSTMTSVVDDLSHQILTGTDEIGASAKEAASAMRSITARMADSIDHFRRDLGAAREGLNDVLNEMAGMVAQAREICGRIEGRNAKIRPEIAAVIMSLQSHDICRQKMEHVSHAFSDISDRIGRAGVMDAGEHALLPHWVRDALGIQALQLDQVVESTDEAARGISAHLSMIAELGRQQTADACSMLDEKGSGSRRLHKINSELEALTGTLAHIKGVSGAIISAMTDVSDRIGSMSSQVANIELISDNINLLALNAIIKVARTGEAGRSLAVLSEEIKKLSDNAKEEIAKGASAIHEILSVSADMKERLSAELTRQVRSTEEIQQKTGQVVELLLNADQSIQASIREVSEGARRLEEDISAVVASITFREIIRSSVGAVASDVRGLYEEIRGMIPDTGGAYGTHPGLDLSEFERRYTMQSERDIHEMHLGAARGNAAVSSPAAVGDDGLGDNVELF